MSDSSDEELRRLVAAAAAGDDNAFTALVRELHGKLYRWALIRVGDPDVADDLVQETFLRAHQALHQYRGASKVSTWIFRIMTRIAINTHRNELRRMKHLERMAGDVPSADAAADSRSLDAIHNSDMLRLVGVFLQSLPPRQREVFNLVDVEGIGPQEVSEMLQMEPVTVRANLFKARRAIRKRLLTEGFTEAYEH